MSAGQTKSQNVRQDLRCVPLAVRKSIATKKAQFSVTLLVTSHFRISFIKLLRAWRRVPKNVHV